MYLTLSRLFKHDKVNRHLLQVLEKETRLKTDALTSISDYIFDLCADHPSVF